MFVFLNSGCSAYLITPTLLNSLPVTHECLVLSLCCSAAAGEGRGEQGPASHVRNYKVDDLYQILRGSDKNDFKPKPKSSVYEFKGSGAMFESIPRTPNPYLAAAKIQDKGSFRGFHLLSLMGEERIQIQIRRQKVCGSGRTPGMQGCKVQEVAALLFMSPVASKNILYHVHSWLSTNSKINFYYHLESHFQRR